MSRKENAKKALRELQWECDDKRFELIDRFRNELRSLNVTIPERLILCSASVELRGHYEDMEYNLLQLAIEEEQLAIRDYLLECGIDLQKEVELAIERRRVGVVKALLTTHPSAIQLDRQLLNAKDHNEDTFLHHAMRYALITDDYSLVIKLIESGAFLFECNEAEVTPWDIANNFEPINKAAKLKHTAFLYEIAYAMLIERKYHCSQTFSAYQEELLELLQSQHNFIKDELKKPLETALRQLAMKQLDSIDELLFILAQSHGKMDDNFIHQAIIHQLQTAPVVLDYGNFSADLARIHAKAFRQPGFAFNVVEKLIRDDERRLEAYAHNTGFFPRAMPLATTTTQQRHLGNG